MENLPLLTLVSSSVKLAIAFGSLILAVILDNLFLSALAALLSIVISLAVLYELLQ